MPTVKNKISEQRLEVIKTAKKLGISKSADLYNVNRSTIRRWIKQYDEKT